MKWLKSCEYFLCFRGGGGGKVKFMVLYVIYKSKIYLELIVIVFCRYSLLGYLEEVV